MNPHIELIKSLGLRVFVHDVNNPTYCNFTDGTCIGYAHWSHFREHVSTVHIPNTQTGTGFQYADEITKESVIGALNCVSPHWWTGPQPTKWRDWEHFFNSSAFNRKQVEI